MQSIYLTEIIFAERVEEHKPSTTREPTSTPVSASKEENDSNIFVIGGYASHLIKMDLPEKNLRMLQELFQGRSSWATSGGATLPANNFMPKSKSTFSEAFLADTTIATVPVQDLLTTQELSKIIQPDAAVLAYLSACSSAATLEEKLADESLHVAAQFILLGFTHVIGTLWESDSACCATVAEKFYSKWLHSMKGSGGDVDPYPVAEALSEAIYFLRDGGYGPILWAPFIHLGR